MNPAHYYASRCALLSSALPLILTPPPPHDDFRAFDFRPSACKTPTNSRHTPDRSKGLSNIEPSGPATQHPLHTDTVFLDLTPRAQQFQNSFCSKNRNRKTAQKSRPRGEIPREIQPADPKLRPYYGQLNSGIPRIFSVPPPQRNNYLAQLNQDLCLPTRVWSDRSKLMSGPDGGVDVVREGLCAMVRKVQRQRMHKRFIVKRKEPVTFLLAFAVYCRSEAEETILRTFFNVKVQKDASVTYMESIIHEADDFHPSPFFMSF